MGSCKTCHRALGNVALAVLALALCGPWPAPAQAQDKLDRYQAQFAAEPNPARKAKILGEMGPLEIALVRTTFKSGQDEKALDILMHYSDDVHMTVAALNATGVDPVSHPNGFKELQIGLRVSLRQLDDLILEMPVDKRPFFRAVRMDLGDVENNLIDALFPTSNKSLKKKD
jgi:hypothetical protein